MKNNLISAVKFLLLFTVTGLLLFFSFRGISFRAVFTQLLKAKIGWVLLSLLISFIALIVRALRWKLLIQPLGYNPTLKNTACSVAVGYLANLAFPRLGEVSRCGTLGASENIPFNKLLGTVVVERIIDVISLVVCIVLVAIIEFNRLGSFLRKSLTDPLLNKINQIFSTFTGIVFVITVLIILVFLTALFIRNSKERSKSKWANLINGFLKGLSSVKNLSRPWLFVFHSIFIWLLYYLSVYVCLFALPFTSYLGLAAALFLLVAGGIGMSAPVQGGIGAYHLLVSQGLLLYNLSLENGLAFATLLHSIQLIMVVITGVIALLFLFFQKRYKATKTATSIERINSA